ncbi:type II secretion system GspH family protein [Patescibacteria group bacterium]|nr:type II secretion system GspH family protein [Patescibacteria group bacterium]
MKKRRGFTIVEVMVVTAILAIIAVLALPAIFRSRKIAAEARQKSAENYATQTLELLARRQGIFKGKVFLDKNNNNVGEYGTLIELASADPPFMDHNLINNVIKGYKIEVTIIDGEKEQRWHAVAVPRPTPEQPVPADAKAFYIDEAGVLRSEYANIMSDRLKAVLEEDVDKKRPVFLRDICLAFESVEKQKQDQLMKEREKKLNLEKKSELKGTGKEPC